MYESMAVPDSWLGIVSMILMFSNVIANTYSGKLLKYFETGKITCICVLLIGASIAGVALSGTFVFLCIFAVLIGLGMGFIDASLNSFVAIHFKAKHMNWLHCFWGVGAAASPVVFSYGLTRSGSWRPGYFVLSGFLFGVALISISALPKWKKATTAAEQVKELIKIKFWDIFRLKGLKLSLVVFFCYCAVEMNVGVWGSSYLVMVKNVSPELAARWISLFFLGMTLERLACGFLPINLENHKFIRIGCAVFALGIITMFLSSGDIAYMGGFFLMGIGYGPVFPCLMFDTPKHFGEEYSPTAVGLQLASANVSCSFTPFLFGTATAYFGYGFFPLFLGIWLTATITTIEVLNR